MDKIITVAEVRKCKSPKLLREYAIGLVSTDIKIAVAQNPNTSSGTLSELTYDSNKELALILAKNRRTGKSGLYNLGVNYYDPDVALCVARNGSTSTKALDRMFDIWKDYPEIVKAIKTNPNVSDSVASLCTYCEME